MSRAACRGFCSAMLWCHLSRWLPQSPYSPALNCFHSEVTHTCLLLINPLTRSSQRLPGSLMSSTSSAARAGVSHSRSEGAQQIWEDFQKRHSMGGPSYCFISGTSQGAGGWWWARPTTSVGAGGPQLPPLLSSSLHFWVTLFYRVGLPQTWARVWGWGSRRPRFIESEGHQLLPCHRCHRCDNHLHRKYLKCILLRYPGSV